MEKHVIVCSPKVAWYSSLDIVFNFKDPELVQSHKFEINEPQTYRGKVYNMDGWEVLSYATIPFWL